MRIISLMTDFGTGDEYVGVMKGVILGIHPHASIVDITHGINPRDLVQAAYMIESAYRYFPANTVHVIVVDPGVGTERAILAIETEQYVFLAPDNGVLTRVAESEQPRRTVRVENRDCFLKTVSRTFHGRDIFAPVAAHIANGLDIADLGPQIDPVGMKRLDIELPSVENSDELGGTVVSVDRFGNLVTNIGEAVLENFCNMKDGMAIELGGKQITGFAESYGECAPKTPLGIIGSRGYLEISVNCGNAAKFFNIREGGKVRVVRNKA